MSEHSTRNRESDALTWQNHAFRYKSFTLDLSEVLAAVETSVVDSLKMSQIGHSARGRRHSHVETDSVGLPRRAQALIACVAAVVAVAAAYSGLRLHNLDLPALVLLAVLGMTAERFDIDLYGDSRLSISALFLLTAAIAIGPVGVVMIGPAIAIAGHIGRGRPLYKLLFNASTFVGTGLASAYVFMAIPRIVQNDTRAIEMTASMLAALVDFGVSSALVTLIIGYTTSAALGPIWREKFRWLAPHYLLLGFLAFVLTLAYREFDAYGILGFIAPALMTRFTVKQYVERTERAVVEIRAKHAEVQALTVELQTAYNETLAALVAALDLRDTETHGHSLRVTELSLRIGEELGIERESREWRDLKHGAMLHDVGKVGVPDSILRKPGPLTDDEWSVIREHPLHGYNMLRAVRFLSAAAELVMCHHERYDGHGYPRGLRGEEIPLGARIFAVADAFDAITSARPYKPAHSEQEALREISLHSGSQFDPQVVAALLEAGSDLLLRAA